jgi:lipopolysaccharide transport system ATP-binding protein
VPEILIVQGVGKRFKLHRNRPVTLKESVVRRLTGRRADSLTILWALRDVNLSVEQGRTFGIIGHNGAGKSTLLRLICGLGRPTAGKIQCLGQVGSLLELGSGFHHDLTGRENLITGGILSGLTKREVKAGQDEIIAFAELEDFIDQPVRTYSTGMFLRLAFATAIHFHPDFLVIDEVLAVGDTRFQQKCLDKLKAFRKAGKSLVIVSHDLDQIRHLCDEVLVLEEGRVATQGDPESAIGCYHDLMRRRTERRATQLGGETRAGLTPERGSRMGTQEAEICEVRLNDGRGKVLDSLDSGSSLTIELEYLLRKPIPDMAFTLGIYNEANIRCFETHISTRATFGQLPERGVFRCRLPELPLLPGHYYINVGFYPPDWSFVYDYHWQMHPLHVISEKIPPAGLTGVLLIRPEWSKVAHGSELLAHGI